MREGVSTEEYEIIVTAYIYALWDKDESDVFYIGATQYPSLRLKEHKRKASTWNESLQRYVLPEGKNINLKIIEEVQYEIANIEPLRDAERYWIHKFLSEGYKLTNKQLYDSVELNDIPIDIMDFVLITHQKLFKKKKPSNDSLAHTIIHLLRQSMEHDAANP